MVWLWILIIYLFSALLIYDGFFTIIKFDAPQIINIFNFLEVLIGTGIILIFSIIILGLRVTLTNHRDLVKKL